MKLGWFLLCACIFTNDAIAQSPGSDRTGGMTGVVTDAVSHLPVKKAAVSLSVMGNWDRNPNQGGQASVTDASGTFTMANLAPGHYQLLVQHQNYPQARFGRVREDVEIKAGEIAGPVTVELIPGSAISGRVVDEDGDPIQGCFIQAHPAAHSEQGVPMGGGSGSNEEGEYRAYGIAPGKYLLTVQCGGTVFQPRPFSAGPDPPPSRAYPPQFYPLTSDIKAAQPIELTPGAERSGIDFRMKPAAVTQIHGVFSTAGADWHGEGPINVQLTLAEQAARSNFMGGQQFVNFDKGTFEFQRVFPGSYVVFAFSRMGRGANTAGAMQRIEVGDRPLDMVLELRYAIDLGGRVEIEGGGTGGSTNSGASSASNAGRTKSQVTPNQINIQLIPEYQVGMPGSNAQVNDDGAFTLKGVIPGLWRLQVNGPFVFLKSAWLGSTDVTNTPMDLSSGAGGGALRIVMSTNTATIRGSAPVGEMVFARRVGAGVGGQGTGVDQNGQYNLQGLAPGKYKLMVVAPGTPMPDEGGQEVTVQEGETVMVELKPQTAQ